MNRCSGTSNDTSRHCNKRRTSQHDAPLLVLCYRARNAPVASMGALYSKPSISYKPSRRHHSQLAGEAVEGAAVDEVVVDEDAGVAEDAVVDGDSAPQQRCSRPRT